MIETGIPHNLVAAFRATLEGITEADAILHVADISHPMVGAQVATTEKVLSEQGAGNKPSLLVWNKIDLVQSSLQTGNDSYKDLLTVSALTGEGIPKLLLCVENILNKELKNITLEIPYSEGTLLSGIFTVTRLPNFSTVSTNGKALARWSMYPV